MRWPVIMLGFLLALARTAGGETLCVYTEERVDGEEPALPFPTMEGVLEFLFESEHVVFESGAAHLPVDWEKRSFNSVRSLAREGGAAYLLVARVLSTRSPQSPPRVECRAEFYLMKVANSQLIAEGRLEMDNAGREEKLSFRGLAFQLGQEIGRQTLRSWPGSDRSAALPSGRQGVK